MLIFILICLIVFAIIYFLPYRVAVKRHHKQVASIFVLNLLLGWSIVGWAIALAWAFLKEDNEQN